MKIAIVQDFVPPYRVPFFNQLDTELSGNLTLFVNSTNNTLLCEQIHINSKKIGNTFVHTNVKIHKFYEYDLVVMMFDMRWLLLYRLLLNKKIKTVLWGHGMGSRSYLSIAKKLLIDQSSGFIAYEKSAEDFFIKMGIDKKKISYMGNTVYVKNYELSHDKREYFIYLGRIQKRKEIDLLIKAYSKMPKDKINEVGLLIVGDGELIPELTKLTEDLKISNRCKFLPGVYDQKLVKNYLSKAIAYVSPGHVGLGVLHAFAFGVPVITKLNAPHAPEVSNIINGENGILIESDINSLCNALEFYIDNVDIHTSHCISAFSRYSENRTMGHMVKRFANALYDFY